jgi:hypothetical protein
MMRSAHYRVIFYYGNGTPLDRGNRLRASHVITPHRLVSRAGKRTTSTPKFCCGAVSRYALLMNATVGSDSGVA